MTHLKDILTPSFRSLTANRPATLWRRCLSIRSQFCEAVVGCRLLTWDQMLEATVSYRLGASRKGGVIFWQIDSEERIHDGKIVYYQPDCHRSKQKGQHPTWVSTMLKRREPFANATNRSSHCLFGLHLLGEEKARLCGDRQAVKSVAIVEAEKSAVILSQLYPQHIWLASGGLGELQVDKFRPLRGRKVVLFPDTDTDGTAFTRWYETARQVMAEEMWDESPPIHVSPILEQKASAEQKARKIDLIDYFFEP